MLKFLFDMWFSLKCIFNTEINIVPLWWDKELMENGIIDCICSLLSQLWTVLLWLVHTCQTLIFFLQLIIGQSNLPIAHVLWRVFSINDTMLINLLKSLISIIFSFLQPIFPILYIIQFSIFLWYETIKFGEYNHQWNCKDKTLLIGQPAVISQWIHEM